MVSFATMYFWIHFTFPYKFHSVLFGLLNGDVFLGFRTSLKVKTEPF